MAEVNPVANPNPQTFCHDNLCGLGLAWFWIKLRRARASDALILIAMVALVFHFLPAQPAKRYVGEMHVPPLPRAASTGLTMLLFPHILGMLSTETPPWSAKQAEAARSGLFSANSAQDEANIAVLEVH